MFKNLWNKIKIFFRGSDVKNSGLGLGVDLGRDWQILCGLFLLTVVIVLISDVYLFYLRPTQLGDDLKIQLDKSMSLNVDRLDQVTEIWRRREIEFGKLLKEKRNFIDPSL